MGHSQLSGYYPSLGLHFCPGSGESWRDGGVLTSQPWQVAMLFLVGDYYTGCLCGPQVLLTDPVDEEPEMVSYTLRVPQI